MNYRKTLAVLTALAACASVTAMPAGVQNNDNTSIFAVKAAEVDIPLSECTCTGNSEQVMTMN
ncbi:hypothetical protein [Ruminococcus sp. HUN007]|uniref:hypothetical protein n=1 Tax=Ruminococcus sp. HUN007 TaxID=1514668 RepID=UPI0005D2A26F|nr:hypothetical protein [Ruminococcus sp. HUN007]